MQVLNTTNYELFTLRPDNREAIQQGHVKRLAESIKTRDLLYMRPIAVNAKMEIIDGQHRFLAAKSLGVPIYYQIQQDFQPQDLIQMNIVQKWSSMDYLNYYVKNGYLEYQKLERYLKENNINLSVAMRIGLGRKENVLNDFRSGKYEHKMDGLPCIEYCWETIGFIQKMNTGARSLYTRTTRFWAALIKFMQHPDFHMDKWRTNMTRFITRFGPRVTDKDYIDLFVYIYNYRNNTKIQLHELKEEVDE